MRRVLRAWDSHLADPCLPRTLAPRLLAAAEQAELGERGEFFFACIQFCFTATR